MTTKAPRWADARTYVLMLMAEDRDGIVHDMPAVDDINELAAYEEWLAKLDLVRDVLEKLDDVALKRLERVRAELRGEVAPVESSTAAPAVPATPCPTCEAAWAATGVASTVRGLTTLDDVVHTTRESLLDARREREGYERRLTALRKKPAEALAADYGAARGADQAERSGS